MRYQNNKSLWRGNSCLWLGLGVVVLLGGLWGCAEKSAEKAGEGHEGHAHAAESAKPPAEEGGHEGHGHEAEGEEKGHEGEAEGHEGHGHEGHNHGDAPAENLPLETLSEKRCEHEMAQLDCGECRYELGVVRVPQSQQASLLVTQQVDQAEGAKGALDLRCETARGAVAASTVNALVSGQVQRVHRTMGESVKAGDVLLTILSDDFARIRLEHQTVHQKLELAKARKEQFEKTQASLRALLDKLAATTDIEVRVSDFSGMPLGRSKAELLEASSQHTRALAEWKRFERLRDDTLALVKRLRGGSGNVDGLRIGEAKGKLLQARADLSLADKTYKRAKELADQGVVARNDLERAARDLDAAHALFKAALEQVELDLELQEAGAKEALESAKARLQGAMEQAILDADLQLLDVKQELDRCASEVHVSHRQLMLLGLTEEEVDKMLEGHDASRDTLEIRSPVAGVVVGLSAVPGQIVEKGTQLAEVSDTGRVWVWCDVYEKDLARLAQAKLPLPALIHSDAFPGQSFPGQLDYLAPDSDATSRTVKARVTAGSGGGLLRPGMYVRSSVQPEASSQGIWLPQGAVQEDGDTRFVFIKWRDDFYVRRFVQVGPASGGQVPVFAGVAPGDLVVVKGAFYLKSDVLREKMGAGCAD